MSDTVRHYLRDGTNLDSWCDRFENTCTQSQIALAMRANMKQGNCDAEKYCNPRKYAGFRQNGRSTVIQENLGKYESFRYFLDLFNTDALPTSLKRSLRCEDAAKTLQPRATWPGTDSPQDSQTIAGEIWADTSIKLVRSQGGLRYTSSWYTGHSAGPGRSEF